MAHHLPLKAILLASCLWPGLLFAAWKAPVWFWVQKVENLSDRLVVDRVEEFNGKSWRLLCWRYHAEPRDDLEFTGVILPGDVTVANFRLSTVRPLSGEDCRNMVE